MSEEPTPAAREAHSAEVHCAWLPAGRAYGVTRGDPGWAGAAEAALAASVVLVPVFVGRLFVREMTARGAPLEVALAWERATRLTDELYLRDATMR